MQTYKIAIVAGDGIGPEVVASGIAIMDAAVGVASEFAIEYVAAPAGAATYLECGVDVVSMESSLFSRERAPSAV